MTTLSTDVAAPEGANADFDAVQAAARRWIADHWSPEYSLVDWRRKLWGSGWAVPSWPQRWGGLGLPAWADALVVEELVAAGAVGVPVGAGMDLAAPTIMEHGPDRLRELFLQRTVTGEVSWCQLFSEPGAGSDLAGLTTKAELDGDHWVVSGQKLWNTSAHHADFGILVARTNWDVPKHEGLTYFIVPMKQPGVEVRPLKQMNYYASFNEVFLSAARIPKDHVVGEVGEGWSVARTTLAYERKFASLRRPKITGSGRAIEEAQAEADDYFETYLWYPQRAGRVDLAIDHARQQGRNNDPVVRQEIARLITMQQVSEWTANRAAASAARGQSPGPEGSIGKLALSAMARQAAHVHSLIAGASGTLSGSDGPYDGAIAEVLISVPAQSIAGGTDEIQKNILGERILGLPREPSADAGVAFRSVPRNG